MSKIDEKAAELAALEDELGDAEHNALFRYTLADAIRDGSKVSEHSPNGWGDGETACALTAGVIAFRSKGCL